MRSHRTLWAWIGAAAAGALFALSVSRVEPFHHVTAGEGVVAAMIVLFPASFLLAKKAEYLSLLTGLFTFFGIAIGITLDAVLDRSMDRNLFPLEILAFAAIAAPAIVAGTLSGWWRKG